jgi:hypothetical protein
MSRATTEARDPARRLAQALVLQVGAEGREQVGGRALGGHGVDARYGDRIFGEGGEGV